MSHWLLRDQPSSNPPKITLAEFLDLCQVVKLGLLEDDNQYHLAMEEAAVSNSPARLHCFGLM